MPVAHTRAVLCVLSLLAACGTGTAGGERAAAGGAAEAEGSVSVVRYCAKFATAYLERTAIGYAGLSVRTDRKPEIMRWLSNAFSPSDSRFAAGYDCRFTARDGEGRLRTVSVGLFLAGTLEFAHHTKWENLQIIPVEHVVDETGGRAGYGVFKYLKAP